MVQGKSTHKKFREIERLCVKLNDLQPATQTLLMTIVVTLSRIDKPHRRRRRQHQPLTSLMTSLNRRHPVNMKCKMTAFEVCSLASDQCSAICAIQIDFYITLQSRHEAKCRFLSMKINYTNETNFCAWQRGIIREKDCLQTACVTQTETSTAARGAV